MEIRTILVPTDFSEDAETAVASAVELARIFKARLALLHAYHLDIPPVYAGWGGDFVNTQEVFDAIRGSAEASLDALQKKIASQGVEVEGRVVMEHASQAILDEAERLQADLIVMGTRGLTGLKHVVLGSTAERIVRLAPCPVLTVKSSS